MRIKELIIYGDSTSLPRPNDSVESKDTWYWKLVEFSKFQFGLENRSAGGIAIRSLRLKILNDAHYLFPKGNISNKNKMVILSTGVVDAGIHPITYKLKIVNKLPIIGVYLWFFLAKVLKPSRAKIQRMWGYSITSPKKFAKELDQIVTFLRERNVEVCLLLTPIPHVALDVRSPGFRQNVIKYNLIKEELCKKFSNVNLVSLDDFKESYYVSEQDGHHFSKLGHSYIFNRIKSEVNFESL
jgi:lysophospholipase L1-like esterase